MTCTRCTPANPAPKCLTTLTLGIIAAHSANLVIKFHNQTTGHNFYLPGTSDVNGLVSCEASGAPIISGHSYDITVFASFATVGTPLTQTFGAVTTDCIMTRFEYYLDEENTPETITAHTITLQ